MKNKYNPPSIEEICLLQVNDVLNASGGTYGTIGDYSGEFLE